MKRILLCVVCLGMLPVTQAAVVTYLVEGMVDSSYGTGQGIFPPAVGTSLAFSVAYDTNATPTGSGPLYTFTLLSFSGYQEWSGLDHNIYVDESAANLKMKFDARGLFPQYSMSKSIDLLFPVDYSPASLLPDPRGFASGTFSTHLATHGGTLESVSGHVTSVTAVPLPAAAWLLLSGICGFAAIRKRRVA